MTRRTTMAALVAVLVATTPLVTAPTARASPSSGGGGSITISLVATPATGDDFSFTGCRVGDGCSPFTLDDDDDPTNASSLSTGALPAGTYTITQAERHGWSLTDLVCSPGATVDTAQRLATITIDANDQVACEFTNSSASITVSVDVDPASAQTFDFTGCQGSGCAEFALDESVDPAHPATITAAVAPGTYTVSQAAVPNWYLNDITCASEDVDLDQRRVTITVGADDHVHCRFVTFGRRITIRQLTRTIPGRFTYTGCRTGDGCSEFVLDNEDDDSTHPNRFDAADLSDGTYVITQAETPGWTLQTPTCTAGVQVSGRQVSIDLPPGRGMVAACTYINRTTGIMVVQDTAPDDPQDFAYTGCSGSGCADFVLDDDRDPGRTRSTWAAGLAPGTYTVTQAAVPGWPLRRIDCLDESVDLAQRRTTITLTPGEEKVCWFTNSRASISVVQDTEPDGPQDFTVETCHFGTGCGTVTLDDDDDPGLSSIVHTSEHPVGTYWIRHRPVPGFTRPDIICRTTPSASVEPFADGVIFTVGSTTAIACTFTNQPAGPPLTDVDRVSGGYSAACARTNSGRVTCWGGRTIAAPEPAEFATLVTDDSGGALTGVTSVSVGGESRCILGQGGRVRCWGSNRYGQIGDGTFEARLRPAAFAEPTGTALTGATQISAGYGHTCAVLLNTQARCWGWNRDGQLGDGTTTDRSRPAVVSNPDGTGPLTGVVLIEAGGLHTCATLADGQVRCWGKGALGAGAPPGTASSRLPRVVSNPAGTGPLDQVEELTVSDEPQPSAGHTCARLASGEVQCWGRGASGQLGDATTNDAARPVPVLGVSGPGALTGVVGLAAGDRHTCARLANGEARCWGTAGSGELGNDATSSISSRPVVVVGPDGSGTLGGIDSITAGHQFTCATTTSGPTWCWGQNFYGTLATGSLTRWSRPVEVLTEP